MKHPKNSKLYIAKIRKLLDLAKGFINKVSKHLKSKCNARDIYM